MDTLRDVTAVTAESGSIRANGNGSIVGLGPRAILLGEALYQATALVASTARIEVHGKDEVLAYKRQGRSLIFAGWHSHDFVNLGAYLPVLGSLGRGALMLRDNPDGRVLYQFGRRMGFKVVSLGATPDSPRWAREVATLIGLVRKGYDAMLAVDGPQGPIYTVKPGAAHMALRANAAIVPTTSAASPALRLTYRWDKHLVPLPGARVVIEAGPVIDPFPPGESPLTVEEICSRLGTALNAGARRAEARLRRRQAVNPGSNYNHPAIRREDSNHELVETNARQNRT